jgi:hypothetical protein
MKGVDPTPREDGLAARRRKALAEEAGSLPGVWKRRDLERLRDDWDLTSRPNNPT